VGEPEIKRPLRRPVRRWEDNIKMDLREIEWGTGTAFIWLRKVGCCEHSNEPSGFIKMLGNS
jgi:hypothetical protein